MNENLIWKLKKSTPKHVHNALTVKTWLKASKVMGGNYHNKKTLFQSKVSTLRHKKGYWFM